MAPVPLRWLVALAFPLIASCSDRPLIAHTPTIDEVDDQQATCKVAKDPLNPLIIEWPGTSKVDLDSASQRGLVAVSYAGCTLKVLPACEVGGSYTLARVTPARDRMEMSSTQELYARLPLGAASLKGQLGMGSKLELDYVAIGQRVADRRPETLTGECTGATHYVRTITIGAYSLDAVADANAGASVEVANAGAGLGRSEAARRIRGSGDVETCAAHPEAAPCGAVIQLGLAPLSRADEGPTVALAAPPPPADGKSVAAPSSTAIAPPTASVAASVAPTRSSGSAVASGDVGGIMSSSVRDPSGVSSSRRARAVLVSELQVLEKLFAATAKGDPDRLELALRLAMDYRELAAVAGRDADKSGGKDKTSTQVQTAARQSAIKYLALVATEYPDGCPNPSKSHCTDEALYFLGYERETGGDPDRARLSYSTLIHGFPSSKYVPYAHHAIGVIALAGDGPSLSRAEQAFREVAKYPLSPVYPEAQLGLAEVKVRQGDRDGARAIYRDLATRFSSSHAATQIPQWAK